MGIQKITLQCSIIMTYLSLKHSYWAVCIKGLKVSENIVKNFGTYTCINLAIFFSSATQYISLSFHRRAVAYQLPTKTYGDYVSEGFCVRCLLHSLSLVLQLYQQNSSHGTLQL